jgi:hypothetical protein
VQHVAGVKIGVQAQLADPPGAFEAAGDVVEQVFGDAVVGVDQFRRYEILLHQVALRFVPVGLDVDLRAVPERTNFALQVYARDQAPELLQHARRIRLRSAAAAAWEDGQAEGPPVVQGDAVALEGRDHRNFPLLELQRVPMLLENRLVAPAARPVELGDDRLRVLQPDAVDAVLVAVEREEAAVAREAQFLERLQDVVRAQRPEGVDRIVRRLPHQPLSSPARTVMRAA